MRLAKATTLTPIQQTKWANRISRGCDFYVQMLIKHRAEPSIAHSFFEVIFWALLESNPDVSSLVPQPFKLTFARNTYVPDCWYLENGKQVVVEIGPEDRDLGGKEQAVREYLWHHNMEFKIITNEELETHQIFAENWLFIVRTLQTATEVMTEPAEFELLDKLLDGPLAIGDILDFGDRVGNCEPEVALYRLAHRGKLKIDLKDHPICSESRVELCR